MSAALKTGLQQLEALIGTRRHTAACLLLAFVMLPFLLLFWGMHAWALLSPEARAFYQAPRLHAMQGLLSVAIIFLGWVIAFGWPRRDSERRRARLVLATTVVLGLVLMTLALGYGLKDTPMGLLLLSFLIVARTFFTARELAPAMFASAALLALNEILLAAGVIPYAPLLSAPVFAGGALAWWWAIWMRVTFDVGIAFFCAALFFLSWVKERRQRALENLTRVDALTGLLNRATFMRMFEEECAKQARNRRPACVLMCDLDFFRRVNDTYGHPAGDLVLMRLGHLLKSATRHPVDLSARYGGEEFVVLLPETNLEAAQRVAARIGEQLRGQIFEIDGQQFSVTISIGIAQAVNGNGDQALRVADENLFRAKHGGRDCVVASRAA
jgi:diguanylate cyclase (GGDEF)-like protein